MLHGFIILSWLHAEAQRGGNVEATWREKKGGQSVEEVAAKQLAKMSIDPKNCRTHS